MSVVYDLLIIYVDGSEKVVQGVSSYRFYEECDSFCFNKNNHQSFIPQNQVRFIGRRFDYENL